MIERALIKILDFTFGPLCEEMKGQYLKLRSSTSYALKTERERKRERVRKQKE